MRILSTVRPTKHQRKVMAIIATAPTPKLAAGQLVGDTNLVAARNMLAKLGIITFTDAHAEFTDAGSKLATEENITDEMGEATEDAKQLAMPDQTAQAEQPAQDPMAAPPMDQGMDLGMGEAVNAIMARLV